jgi:hypothetical protein
MTDTIPAARNNNLVAESDLTSALQALEQRFKATIAAAADVADHEGDDTDTDNHLQKEQQQLQLQQLLKDCQNSLSANIQRIVQPVSDEAFHMYVYQQQQQQTENDENEHENSNNKQSSSSSKSHVSTTTIKPVVTVEEPVWDEDDLMDPLALERVQALRHQVRTSAAKVQTQQQAVLAKAVAVAERQVQLLVRTRQRNNTNTAANNPDDEKNKEEDKEQVVVLPPESVAKIQEMQTCLMAMTTALQKTEQDLPDKLTSLQETVAAIQANFAKPTLSQTEQAIRAREYNNAGSSTSMITTSGTGANSATAKTMEPAARLANFLRSD